MSDNWLSFEGRRYNLKPEETALDTMLRGGANVAFSCRKGSCRSCLLEAVSGDPGTASQAKLSVEMRERNLFLPCMAKDMDRVEARIPDLSQWFIKAIVAEKNQLSADVWQIMLEPETAMEWQAGQFIGVRNAVGDVRSYSLAGPMEDYFLELHVRHYADGRLSNWLVSDVSVGDMIDIQGPTGTCYYDADMAGKPLLLVGSGTGAAPLIGIAKEALTKGHDVPIRFFHGAQAENLYLNDALTGLAANANFKAVAQAGRITDVAFDGGDLSDHVVFVAGNPDMVETARYRAVYNGARVENIYSDPFDTPELYQPNDMSKYTNMEAQPELWAALGDGAVLSELLEKFYVRVYADARLAPFFHNVTQKRAAEKQYEFLRDLFVGSRTYFGEKPFNAHHWMVISDELFDYRERLFFDVVAEYDLPQHLVNRWAAIQELFRREIVKYSPRGIYRDGVEHVLEGYVTEEITVATVCDGCFAEIHVGDQARMHTRTGELFCKDCDATQH